MRMDEECVERTKEMELHGRGKRRENREKVAGLCGMKIKKINLTLMHINNEGRWRGQVNSDPNICRLEKLKTKDTDNSYDRVTTYKYYGVKNLIGTKKFYIEDHCYCV